MDKKAELSGNASRAKTTKSIDKRAERTRSSLRMAFSQLLQRHKYEEITVEDIARAASVGRSTFYAHYADKNALKREGIEQLRKQLLRRGMADGGMSRHSFTLAIFEQAREHIDHFRALAGGRGSSVAMEALQKTIQNLARQEFANRPNQRRDLSVELQISFVTGSFMAVLVKWLEGGAKESPSSIDAAYQYLLQEGLGRKV